MSGRRTRTRVVVSAPAKINLHLAVGERRPDGFHDVVTVLQTLALADEVTVEPAEELSLSCEPGVGVPAERNLAWRAGLAAGEALGRPPAYAIRVRKAIPVGAGLGGGSADAAAVLRAAARLEATDARDPRLVRAAATLGADVPFFLTGGAALLGGRGDVLLRELRPLRVPVVLASQGTRVRTAEAYAAFDRLAHEAPPDVGPLVAAMEAEDVAGVSRKLYNNMTEASLAVAPGIAEVLGAMRAADGVLAALLAGSGSAVFGVAESHEAAACVANELEARGLWAVATETTDAVKEREEEVP